MHANTDVPVPMAEEVRAWMLHVVQHVCHVEHFLTELGLGSGDPERPHDIVGNGNKFEWEVLRGFAVQYRDPSPGYFDRFVRPSLDRHRCQYHHCRWNEETPEATVDDMKLGAVDAICSLLEPRRYQGGRHSFDEILALVEGNPPHRRPWLRELMPEIRRLTQPKLEAIASLDDIPNIGIPAATHDIIRQRVEETRRLMRERGYVF